MIKSLFSKHRELAIATVSGLFFILILLDVVYEGALFRFDAVVHQWSLGWHTPLGDKLIFGLTHLGDLVTMLLYSIVLTLLMYHKKMWREIRFYWVGMLGSSVLFSAIKELVGRTRPSSYIGDFHQHGYSFPSGHSTMSVTWALLLFLIFSPRVSRQYLPLFTFFCLLFPLTIIFSRIYLGVHYFSDVAGGMTLGIFWVMLAAWYFGRHPFVGNSEEEAVSESLQE